MSVLLSASRLPTPAAQTTAQHGPDGRQTPVAEHR